MNELIDNEIYDGSTKFRLYGIINHKGDVNSGHYYNYNFIDGEWFKFDDGVVLKENPNFNSNEVYTLFYTKVNN
jgi:ubiquitin carboxyl-terminal hydrolase 22/27/51